MSLTNLELFNMLAMNRPNQKVPPQLPQQSGPGKLPEAQGQHGAKHALIVEDNVLNAEILTTLLNAHGLTCTVIESPRDLEAVMSTLERIDLIFLDLEFRDYDGFEVHRQLKQDPRTRGVPVVAYTVHTSEIQRARREGFHSFLGKPLKQQRFAENLRHILNDEPVWDI
jgi:CheY-like chemotaxis protein